MLDKIPSYFDLNVSFFVLLVIGILSGLFAYYQYKRTVPPITKFYQILLGIIRAIAVASILLLLFTPEFTAIWQKTESGKLILAIDKSASMNMIEEGKSRLKRALDIADNIIKQTQGKTDLAIYGFDIDTIQYQNLRLDTTSLGTNIDKSLRSIVQNEPKASNIILITDGNFSVGDNPLYSDYLKNIKLYTVGVGDTLEVPDVMITEIKSNRIVYQNLPTQIQVFVLSRGINAQRLRLSMQQGGQVLQVKDVDISGDGKTVVAEFEHTPELVGLNQFDFSLQKIPGETITSNNNYTISMDVLKRKIKVGLLSSKPGYESKFLQHMLSNQEDIRLYKSVRLKSGQYFKSNPKKHIDSLDVVILHNYPSANQSDPLSTQMINRLNALRVPAFIILSEAVTRNQIESLKKFFPIKSIKNSNQLVETQIHPTVLSEQIPVLSIFDDDDTEQKFWSICPPIQFPYSEILFSSPVKVLLQTNKLIREKTGQVVLSAHESRGRKGILLLGSGFWRWEFLLSEDQINRNSWQKMIKNMIRWLDTGAVDKNVILSSSKKNYQVGDNILLVTQVYDGSFNFVNDGLIRTNVTGPSVSFEIESNFIENGRYEGTFIPLIPGRYKIRSDAWRNNINLGSDQIELIITTVNREFLSTRQNNRFLNRLSEKSGGLYVNEDEAEKLVESLNLNPELKQETETIEMWNHWPFMLIIIILLSVEWFIRKKKDLA